MFFHLIRIEHFPKTFIFIYKRLFHLLFTEIFCTECHRNFCSEALLQKFLFPSVQKISVKSRRNKLLLRITLYFFLFVIYRYFDDDNLIKKTGERLVKIGNRPWKPPLCIVLTRPPFLWNLIEFVSALPSGRHWKTESLCKTSGKLMIEPEVFDRGQRFVPSAFFIQETWTMFSPQIRKQMCLGKYL